MNSNITLLGLQYISFGLLTNRYLTHLNLQGLNMNKNHNQLINNIISFNRSIEVLNLSHNEFNNISLSEWEKGLVKNNSLRELNLSGNQLKND